MTMHSNLFTVLLVDTSHLELVHEQDMEYYLATQDSYSVAEEVWETFPVCYSAQIMKFMEISSKSS